MGFAVASKGALLSGLLKKFLLAAPSASALGPRSVAGACRLCNTGGPPHRSDESGFSYGYYPPASALDPLERGFWISKDEADAMEMKVAMLGMPKEQVKLSAYQNALLVKWEGVKVSDGDDDPAWIWRINLSPVAFTLNQAKAELQDGLLTITVPKINKGEVIGECIDIKID